MSLVDQIKFDLEMALRNGLKDEVATLRLLLSEIHNYQIAKSPTNFDLGNEEIVGIISKEIKKRRESIEAFEKAKRDDLVEKERKELEVLERYLPKQMTRAEIEALIDELITEIKVSSQSDFGKVMSKLMPKVKGRADGSVVSQIVKERLGILFK